MYAAALATAVGVWDAGAVPRVLQHRAVLEVRATDFAFEAEERIEAGPVTVRLRNDGLSPHQAWVVALDGGHTLRDLERDLAGRDPSGRDVLPSWVRPVGGPSAVGSGGQGEVTLALRAGRHAIVCVERLADGVPALMKGMYRALEVVEHTGRAERMATNGTLVLTDASLTTQRRLRRGRRLVRVSNESATTRELRVYRLARARDLEALRDWLAAEQGAPPAVPVTGIVGLPAGGEGVLALELKPGDYALVSRHAAAIRGKRRDAVTVLRPLHVD